MEDVNFLIKKLQLKPHPEGGYYSETYRSAGMISQRELGDAFDGERHYSTGIYFLLTPKMFSAFHRIQQDEMWHFYKGVPVSLHMIDQQGNYSVVTIGNDIHNDEHPQYVVPGGVWFASHIKGDSGYSLTGCTVAPGFDFRDFELAKRSDLLKVYPDLSEIIIKLTRE